MENDIGQRGPSVQNDSHIDRHPVTFTKKKVGFSSATFPHNCANTTFCHHLHSMTIFIDQGLKNDPRGVYRMSQILMIKLIISQ